MRKEEWIKIITPEGEDMIASPQYIKELMGIDLSSVVYRLIETERKIDRLESPLRQAKVLALLQSKGKHSSGWLENRVSNFRRHDLNELIHRGLVIESKSGTHKMYSSASPPKKKD